MGTVFVHAMPYLCDAHLAQLTDVAAKYVYFGCSSRRHANVSRGGIVEVFVGEAQRALFGLFVMPHMPCQLPEMHQKLN